MAMRTMGSSSMMARSPCFRRELLQILLLILIDRLRLFLQPVFHVEFDLLQDLFDGTLLALYHFDDLPLRKLKAIEFTKDFLV